MQLSYWCTKLGQQPWLWPLTFGLLFSVVAEGATIALDDDKAPMVAPPAAIEIIDPSKLTLVPPPAPDDPNHALSPPQTTAPPSAQDQESPLLDIFQELIKGRLSPSGAGVSPDDEFPPSREPPIPNAQLGLEVSKTQAKIDEPVRLEAVLESHALAERVEYQFLVDGQVARPWDQSASTNIRFHREGRHELKVIARVPSPRAVTTARVRVLASPAVSIFVRSPWVQPRVRIEPSQIIVEQGQDARFESVSSHDPKAELYFHWLGPGEISGRDPLFVVSTAQLDPGKYDIELVVYDSREQRGQATATLEVRGHSQAPVAVIAPKVIEVFLGQEARFESRSRHDPQLQLSQHWIGPTGQRASGGEFVVDTHGLRLADYRVMLEI